MGTHEKFMKIAEIKILKHTVREKASYGAIVSMRTDRSGNLIVLAP